MRPALTSQVVTLTVPPNMRLALTSPGWHLTCASQMCRRRFGSVSQTASAAYAPTDDRSPERSTARSGSPQAPGGTPGGTPGGGDSSPSPVRFVPGPQPPLPPRPLCPPPVPLVSPPLPQKPVAASPTGSMPPGIDGTCSAQAADASSVLSPTGVRPASWLSSTASCLYISASCLASFRLLLDISDYAYYSGRQFAAQWCLDRAESRLGSMSWDAVPCEMTLCAARGRVS